MMVPNENKLARLTAVARMYYEQDMTQSDIAKMIDVSRPMVSKLLTEAKELGIVTIKINEILSAQQMLADKLKNFFGLKDATVIAAEGGGAAVIDKKVALATYELLKKSGMQKQFLGVGCGSAVGILSDLAASGGQPSKKADGDIFPLIGGLKASLRSYHTNELVRTLSEATGFRASYMYLPALATSEEEKQLLVNTELFHSIEEKWRQVTFAILNVSNLYSTPDLATSIRFGRRLTEQRAVGRVLAHYFDKDGNIIEPENDNAIQISVEELKSAERVIAMCSSVVEPRTVLGALRTGLVTNVVVSDELAMKVCELVEQSV